jgi:hypothetical protein
VDRRAAYSKGCLKVAQIIQVSLAPLLIGDAQRTHLVFVLNYSAVAFFALELAAADSARLAPGFAAIRTKKSRLWGVLDSFLRGGYQHRSYLCAFTRAASTIVANTTGALHATLDFSPLPKSSKWLPALI